MAKVDESIDYKADEKNWQRIMELRDEILRVLEDLRQKQVIGSNQEASVTIRADEKTAQVVDWLGLDQFAAMCIISEMKLEKVSGETEIIAEKCGYAKCDRCWNHRPSVGQKTDVPELCGRCAEVVSGIQE